MNYLKRIFLITTLILLISLNASCGKKYNVKFISDNEIFKEVEVKKGQTISNEEISKEGYEFLGWYLNDTEYDFNTFISSDIELVAKWEEKVLKASFKIKGSLSLYKR